ncbi:MAG: peptidoglycan DD-metalloendopeptidase family protein [Deltaproteobacteria bacterium]|nr:peptidoglycan DD-metalloendopeptidase family protein [Deltaproteobacteria bacterium]
MAESPEKKDLKSLLRPVLLLSLAGLALILSAIFLLSPEAYSEKSSGEKTRTTIDQAPLSSGGPANPGVPPDVEKSAEGRYDFRINGGQTFYSIMTLFGLPGSEIQAIAGAARPVYDLRQLKQDTVFRIFTLNKEWRRMEYRFSAYETLVVEKDEGSANGVKAAKTELPHEQREVVVSGVIESSLYEDGVKAGADPQVMMNLTDIFAWDVDFTSDIQKGDTFRVLYEALYVDGAPVSAGRILGAEMVNEGKKYTAVYFEGKDGYYDLEGRSLRRTLLKSPLRFRRITSYFTKSRFHPILKKFRPHHGIDYGAPKGTPVESAGGGRVAFAGWKNGYGNFIEIRHNNNYSTGYGHLSRIAKGIRTGARVSQGDLIGYVGSTGISTGPHLHYEVKIGGRLINPLSVKAVADASIGKKERQRFAAVSAEVLRKLSGADTRVAVVSPAPSSQPGSEPASSTRRN